MTAILGPDGLPARSVGRWVERKEHFVGRYTSLFARGMRRRWQHRAYVELFSGPGLSYNKATGEFTDGSPIRAMLAELTDFVFVDSDAIATEALDLRAGPRKGGRSLTIITADCNDAVDAVRAALPADALSLAFVDPTGWQVRMQTVLELTRDRRVDLLVTFHAGQMKRVTRYSVPELDAFFGSNSWRVALALPRHQRSEQLLRLYNEALVSNGYLPESWRYAVPLRNSRNVIMYYLVLFTKHERGLDFWRKAIAVDEAHQPDLFPRS